MQASKSARSYSFCRVKKTIPLQNLGATGGPTTLPGSSDARSSLQLPQSNLGEGAAYRKRSRNSLQEANFRAQKQAESFPTTIGIAPASKDRRSLSELPPLGQFAFEERTRHKLQQVPPPTQLSQELSQLRAAIATLQKTVRQLAGMSFSKQMAENNNNNNNNIDHNTTNNTNNNNDNDNNKNGQESSLRSLDLDNENPESSLSGSDLDRLSFDSFAHTVETGFSSSDQQGEASSLTTLGKQTMTIGFSLGSLTQNNQKGMIAGTTWDPSLGMDRDSFDKMKQEKKVTFSMETLAAYKSKQQNNEKKKGSHPGGSQLEQLGHNNEHNNNQQAWQNRPSMMQQQSAAASEKEPEHMQCNAGSFSEDDSFEEDRALGSFEAQPQATTSLPACRFPRQNNNSILGQDLKNKAAWGILIDTVAAMSLAPVSFAPEAELSPLESTLQLRNLTGKAITTYGRRTVELRGSQLSFRVSFVIADVEHVSLGMDIFAKEQLSMIRSSNNEIHLVNKAGAKTQLQQRGHLLYIEACSSELGLSTCRGSSLPQDNGSLLDDKDGTQQDAASKDELDSHMVSASGGAIGTSFSLENLRQQHKNTTSLGATALPAKGAKKRNKKKKPSARRASHNQLDENSSKQKGQHTAAAQLRNLEKTSLIKEIELAAAKEEQESLSKIDQQELSLRILLILSLRYRWQITTTRATAACSEDALGQQLRNIVKQHQQKHLLKR